LWQLQEGVVEVTVVVVIVAGKGQLGDHRDAV
jgi:hypothetical protein